MKKNEIKFVFIISIVSLGIIVLTLIAYNLDKLINFKYFTNSEKYIFHTDKLGHFGDFIGGFLGTILTGVATFLVYKTYVSQKEELEGQRSLITQQQFESTFFNMLNVHRELKKELEFNLNPKFKGNPKIKSEKEKLIGISVIKEVNKCFIIYFNQITKRNMTYEEVLNENKFSVIDFKFEKDVKEYNEKIANDNSEKVIITFVYKKIFEKFQDEIGHYCRNVYHVLKFIRESENNESELNKKISFRKYADIFQSQLNVNEQFLLFYNFIIFDVNDNESYLHPIQIVNHYKFLENLGSDNLLDKKLHNNKNFYNFYIK